VPGRRVVAGEEVGQVFAEFLCGPGSGFFLGVLEAVAGMLGDARRVAAAASKALAMNLRNIHFAEAEAL
jgi:hypothetical protein